MQQIVQERLRQQNRLPTPAPRRPGDRPPPPRTTPGVQAPRPPASRPDYPNRGFVPQSPAGQRPGPRPTASTPSPSRHAPPDRSQRYERHAERKLDSPSLRPQPKVEAPREFRKVTLTEGLTVKDLAEKLDVKSKDMIKKLMDRGVFATINQTLDKEMATEICQGLQCRSRICHL